MTLLAYHVRPDQVEVVTDSMSYLKDASMVAQHAKAIFFPHIGTLLSGTGSGQITDAAKLRLLSSQADDVDGAVVELEAALPIASARAHELGIDDSTILVAFGFSARQARFVGYEIPCGDDVPPRIRYKPIDMAIGDRMLGGDGATRYALWPSHDPGALNAGMRRLEPPTSIDEWRELAVATRVAQTAFAVEERCLMGGRVIYTLLDGSGCHQRCIHTFDDTGDEFAALVAGTAHPAGGQHKWTGVGRNDPCPCGQGRKYKHCHGGSA